MPKPDPATETYESVEKLIYHFAWKFAKKYRRDFDELHAEANLAYVRAYNSYEPGHGTLLSSYVGTCIHRHLLDLVRKDMRRPSQSSLTGTEGDQIPVEDSIADDPTTSLLQDLTDDARMLINLVISTPDDLKQVIEEKGGQPRNYRSSIKLYAWDHLGWEWDRVLLACEELGDALNA